MSQCHFERSEKSIFTTVGQTIYKPIDCHPELVSGSHSKNVSKNVL